MGTGAVVVSAFALLRIFFGNGIQQGLPASAMRSDDAPRKGEMALGTLSRNSPLGSLSVLTT